MSSSTSVGQRLFILLSVLVALAAPVGIFVVSTAEIALRNAILKECQGDQVSLFLLCFDKAWKEGYLPFWQYLFPFLPAVSVACGRWVLDFPRPLFTLSAWWLYLIVEAFLVIVGILLALFSVYDVAVYPLRDWQIWGLLKISYFALAALGAPLILSMLLERPHSERSFKFVRLGTLIVLVAPVVGIAIIIFRQASGTP